MVENDENSTAQQRRYLEQCQSVKQVFISKICLELQGDSPEGNGGNSVDHEQFKKVFIPAFSRPANLRQLVLFKTKNAEMTL